VFLAPASRPKRLFRESRRSCPTPSVSNSLSSNPSRPPTSAFWSRAPTRATTTAI